MSISCTLSRKELKVGPLQRRHPSCVCFTSTLLYESSDHKMYCFSTQYSLALLYAVCRSVTFECVQSRTCLRELSDHSVPHCCMKTSCVRPRAIVHSQCAVFRAMQGLLGMMCVVPQQGQPYFKHPVCSER